MTLEPTRNQAKKPPLTCWAMVFAEHVGDKLDAHADSVDGSERRMTLRGRWQGQGRQTTDAARMEERRQIRRSPDPKAEGRQGSNASGRPGEGRVQPLAGVSSGSARETFGRHFPEPLDENPRFAGPSSTATGIRTRVSGLRIASAKPFAADLCLWRPRRSVQFRRVQWSRGHISGHGIDGRIQVKREQGPPHSQGGPRRHQRKGHQRGPSICIGEEIADP
jgi:hypothetical protein